MTRDNAPNDTNPVQKNIVQGYENITYWFDINSDDNNNIVNCDI
jgi:hypothetical protein